MKKALAVLGTLVAVGLLCGNPVLAQDKKGSKDDKVQTFNFEEDEVTVSFLKPEMTSIGLIEQEKVTSLIKIREDFVDEIVREAEDL